MTTTARRAPTGAGARTAGTGPVAGAPARTSAPAPRWAELAAKATVWTTVPSGLWRIALGLGIPVGFSGETAAAFERHTPGWGTVYVLVLSGLAEFLAFLTLGLVRPWGEVVPRWIPLLGGRKVRPLAAVVPAALGSAVLTWLGATALFGGWAANMSSPDAPHGFGGVVMTLSYLPLVAWGPLVGAVTFSYARRALGRR
ncbi:hypothetical protein [Kitasatospora sp. A2-31]|uniref:hypothetical protein n=1 Tax=Kitasatospora sp. A2-31 TaxID=2916414 RepID=UPI001EEF7072|nr:hypothetical protein [Kitasatospora sp. A2-31]MCG6499557.1 hypothetical protein [Kitasatospora sp. A2-31]